jgi:hypothetical protein
MKADHTQVLEVCSRRTGYASRLRTASAGVALAITIVTTSTSALADYKYRPGLLGVKTNLGHRSYTYSFGNTRSVGPAAAPRCTGLRGTWDCAGISAFAAASADWACVGSSPRSDPIQGGAAR